MFELDDFFENQIKDQELKKQKKKEKLERLQQKNKLIEEIKLNFEPITNEYSDINSNTTNSYEFKKGTLEWAYNILNATNNTTFPELKQKYFHFAKLYHPDKNREINLNKMKELNEAWDLIKTQLR